MKMVLTMALAAGATFAQSTAAPAPAAKSKKTAKAAAPLTIPPTAVDQGNGSFRYVDAKGMAWLYQKTPFGISRSPETTPSGQGVGQTPFGPSKSQGGANSAVAAPTVVKTGNVDDPNAKATAVAKGDMIEFTKPSPFGVTKWQKKKTDLTSDEQKIWARMQPKGNQ